MQRYYSQETGNTYLQDIHQIPDGAKAITEDRYQEVIANPAPGKIRSHDAQGLPILIDPPVYVPTDDDHRAAIAAERYNHETSGISLGGMQIDTGRDSQALITGATVQAMLDPNYSLRWKTPAGFVDLTAEQIIGVATASRAHVQACFNREAELLEALEAGTFTAGMLEEGWPDGSLSATATG